MKNKKLIVLKYGISFAFGAGLVFLTLWLQNFYSQEERIVRVKILADAFTIPGVIITLFGVFIWLVNMGTFNGIGYILKHVIQMLIPFSKKPHETYGEYVEKRKKIGGYTFLYITGLCYLIAAIVFTIMFYCV